MTTESIMTVKPTTLRESDTVAEALLVMHREHVRNLPVVDQAGHFVGLFGIRRLSRLLLPKAAQLGTYSLADLSFLPDDLSELQERLKKVGSQPVSKFLEKRKKLLFCTPQTTFPELLELFYQTSDSSLPVIVVSGKTNKLVGIVSAWNVLDRLIIKIFEQLAEKQAGATPAKESEATEPAAGTEPDTVQPQD
jgi:CBS domain-containing protein